MGMVRFPVLHCLGRIGSVCSTRQMSLRFWRIGQKRPAKVVFMAYRNTLQADALKLVAKKLQSSLAVEGRQGYVWTEIGLRAWKARGNPASWLQ